MAATILIVEDEHAVARGIQYALQQEGYDVGIARSGALEQCAEPGCILRARDPRQPPQ